MTATAAADVTTSFADADRGNPPPPPPEAEAEAGITTTTSSSAKRHAQRGQWQTPPLPAFFAATATSTTAATAHVASSRGNSSDANNAAPPLPTSPDEYARMLHDAYKRGAEAGARASQQIQLVGGSKQEHKPDHYLSSTVAPSEVTLATTTTTTTNMARIGNTSSNVVVPISNNNYYNNNPNSTSSITTQSATSNLNHQHHPNPNAHIHHHPSPMISSSSSSSTATTAATAVPQSKSMPDMASYNSTNTTSHPMMAPSSSSNSTNNNNNNNNDEEYKRKKRLARNRASARLRRLKKKNLVDSYEGEVGILESALGKLKMHRWGGETVSAPSSSSNLNVCNNDNQYEGLIEALSMERGQAPLSPEARRQLIQSILDQQREQVGNLLEVQLENWILCTSFLSGGSGGGGYGNNGNVEDEEMALVASELQSLLQLTPQQVSLMEQQNHQQQGEGGVGAAIMNEIQDLYSVEDCLQSIHSNMWLLDNGVEELSSQLTSILNPTQLSKFLLWSDHNAEAIEKLDFVNVVPLGGGGGEERGGEVGIGGPVFEFGVDEGLAEGD